MAPKGNPKKLNKLRLRTLASSKVSPRAITPDSARTTARFASRKYRARTAIIFMSPMAT